MEVKIWENPIVSQAVIVSEVIHFVFYGIFVLRCTHYGFTVFYQRTMAFHPNQPWNRQSSPMTRFLSTTDIFKLERCVCVCVCVCVLFNHYANLIISTQLTFTSFPLGVSWPHFGMDDLNPVSTYHDANTVKPTINDLIYNNVLRYNGTFSNHANCCLWGRRIRRTVNSFQYCTISFQNLIKL